MHLEAVYLEALLYIVEWLVLQIMYVLIFGSKNRGLQSREGYNGTHMKTVLCTVWAEQMQQGP